MILFHFQTLGAGRHIPIFVFLMWRFFVCVVFFLLEKDRKREKYEFDGLGNPIPYKMMFVSPPR